MEEKKQIRLNNALIFTLCLIFTFSIGIKGVYNNAIVQIREEYGLTNAQTQVGTLIYYLVYALSQIALALNINKINIKKLFIISIFVTSASYVFTLLANSAWKLWLLMGLNGIFQAPHWTGCIYFVAKLLRGKYLQKASKVMSFSNPMGVALASLTVSLFIMLSAWRMAFIALAILLSLSAIAFIFIEGKLSKALKGNAGFSATQNAQNNRNKKAVAEAQPLSKRQKTAEYATLILVAIICLLSSSAFMMIRQVITLYLFDFNGFDKSLSVLVTILLPIFTLTAQLIIFSLSYKYKNFLAVDLIVCAIGVLSCVPLFISFDKSIMLTIVFFVLAHAMIQNSGAIYLTIFSLQARKKINSGSVTGIFNSGASIGCAIGPIISGAILDMGTNASSLITVFVCIMLSALLIGLITTALILTKKKNYIFKDIV